MNIDAKAGLASRIDISNNYVAVLMWDEVAAGGSGLMVLNAGSNVSVAGPTRLTAIGASPGEVTEMKVYETGGQFYAFLSGHNTLSGHLTGMITKVRLGNTTDCCNFTLEWTKEFSVCKTSSVAGASLETGCN